MPTLVEDPPLAVVEPPGIVLERPAAASALRPQRGGGPPHPGENGGGGPERRFPAPRSRLQLGLRLAIASIASLFAAFSLAYVALRWFDGQWRPVPLPGLLFWNTLALASSSVALHYALRRRPEPDPLNDEFGWFVDYGRLRWGLTAAALLGFIFLAGQLAVWLDWLRAGAYTAANPASAFLYLLTLAHALHLVAGWSLLAAAAALAWRGRLRRGAPLLQLASPLWHFLDFLWIYLYLLLRFAR